MSKHGAEFLRSWIEKNVTYLDRGGDYIRAMELAENCRATAATLGIVVDETEGGIGVRHCQFPLQLP